MTRTLEMNDPNVLRHVAPDVPVPTPEHPLDRATAANRARGHGWWVTVRCGDWPYQETGRRWYGTLGLALAAIQACAAEQTEPGAAVVSLAAAGPER